MADSVPNRANNPKRRIFSRDITAWENTSRMGGEFTIAVNHPDTGTKYYSGYTKAQAIARHKEKMRNGDI